MSTAASHHLLTLQGVHTHIGAYHILHGVDLVVPKGQLTLLLGRNGAGKTTLMRIAAGETAPDPTSSASRKRQEIPERREAAVFLRSSEIQSFFLLTNRKIPPKTPLALRALQVSPDS